ncbi:hypothetical protein D3C73_988040 [compost metagenome]
MVKKLKPTVVQRAGSKEGIDETGSDVRHHWEKRIVGGVASWSYVSEKPEVMDPVLSRLEAYPDVMLQYYLNDCRIAKEAILKGLVPVDQGLLQIEVTVEEVERSLSASYRKTYPKFDEWVEKVRRQMAKELQDKGIQRD